ncbi:hypothetical protein JTB14_004111 [Gonioctena quinquepunctata]|nr:hypothetical protein JTB14_004111 [Gonioctena quinquepunctata]
MGIVPNLRAGDWTFQSSTLENVVELAGIQDSISSSAEQRCKLDDIIGKAFSEMGTGLGCTHLVEHEIRTTSAPMKQRYYPISPVPQKIVDHEFDEMLEKGIIEPSSSPWSSPIVMVRKSDNGWRFCVNYKKLNAVSVPDAYPIPYVSSILDRLRDAKYLSTLDIKSAYWQIPVAESSRPLTAFTVPTRGLFQFRRMLSGLHSAHATWQRLIDRVVGADMEAYLFVYLNDVIICTPDFELHL